VCDHVEYLELDVDDVEKLLSRDDLGVANEEDVFHWMMKWIDHDVNRRQNHFSKLLKCVRLTLIAVDFIKKNIEPRCDDECIKLLFQAYRYHATSCNQSISEMKRKNSKIPKIEIKTTAKTERILAIGSVKVSESQDFTLSKFMCSSDGINKCL